jgi:ATP-dependent RNA helicase DeaD
MRYQKDALRVDVRPKSTSDSSHEDIEYVAHLTAIGDHLPAVINVLRANGDGRAIVFGTTREGVAALHGELVRRGFSAVVLSGDRVQHERNRALAALRSGEAKVLVATNVAARGLDLPEVDLVVHADLPLNTEALTHRSGRTGRAGRKGRSVVIANLAERRKAERLMHNAGVRFTWTEVPSAAVIARTAQARLEAALLEEVRAGAPAESAVAELAGRLVTEVERDTLLATLLRRELARLPQGEPVRPVQIKAPEGAHDPFPTSGPRASHAEFARDAVVFRINLGGQSKAEPGWLLPLICRRGGVTRREVGAIRVGLRHSEFEIAGRAAEDFALTAAQPDPRALHVRIERVSSSARPEPARDSRGHRRPSAAPVSAAPTPAVPKAAEARPAAPKFAAPAQVKATGLGPQPAAPRLSAIGDRFHRPLKPVPVSHKPAHAAYARPQRPAPHAHQGGLARPTRLGRAAHPGYEGQPHKSRAASGTNRPYTPAHRGPGAPAGLRPFNPHPFHPGRKKR